METSTAAFLPLEAGEGFFSPWTPPGSPEIW